MEASERAGQEAPAQLIAGNVRQVAALAQRYWVVKGPSRGPDPGKDGMPMTSLPKLCGRNVGRTD